MLTLSTQYRLAHAIKVLAIAEANIEARRKLLSDLTLFEPSTGKFIKHDLIILNEIKQLLKDWINRELVN